MNKFRLIELLNARFKRQLEEKWYCYYLVNHLTGSISDYSFKELNKSLRLHDIT